MNILVTGGTGFIGKSLVTELIKNNEFNIRVFARKPLENYNVAWSQQVNSVQGDLKDRESISRAVHGVDIVIHLAAQLGSWWAKKEVYYEANVQGTEALVEESQREDIQQFIYLSSCGVFGTLNKFPADESHPCNPRYEYEKAKYKAEQLVNKAISKGFPATIIRPSHVYGPGDLNTVPLLKLLQQTHFFPLINGGKSLFQPVYIDDLMAGIIKCISNRKTVRGKTFIFAGEEVITFKQYIALIASLMNISITTVSLPFLLAKSVAIFSESLAKIMNNEPILTNFRVDFFGGSQYYNIQRAKEDLKYSPQIGIEQGMRNAMIWYRQMNLL